MRIDVRTEVVRSNLELLKTLISKAKDREVEAYVESTTGSLMTAKKGAAVAPNWKTIWIRWDTDTNRLEFSGAEGLKEEAEKTLTETIRTVNQIFEKHLKSPEDLKKAEFFCPGSEIFVTVYHGKIDRQKAEKLLEGHLVGTYLFRIDPFAEILEVELSASFAEPVRCFTITVVAENSKITDYTIVERLGKLQIYNDDPELYGRCYTDLEHLLNTLKAKCKIPLKKPERS